MFTGRRWAIAIVLSVMGLGLMILWIVSRPMGSGPVGAELRADQAGSFTEGYEGWVGRPVTFEGFQILNRTGRPETVVSVIPTNVPPHVTLKSGVTQVPPAQGVALGWKTTHWMAVPRSFSSQFGAHGWAPTLGVEATRPGVYVIDGLLVRYRWNHHTYTVYLPDQFVLCAGSHQRGACPTHIAPPPVSWKISLWSRLRQILSPS
ncbi:hypothetical protein SAMN00768000_3054 [Sulfobacillus thermosulfidooxidans DSM 9293]|uniref:Uncharacterized protein n=1 Tax=Sulfobacillus thermosulfidooxidans (strain DSM 9293 / VKM B-1269 / AT-1) TaxID=929705 RepID=A0A1W1WKZ1_SULTA|nr:hypothetical protein [Sulfobacillus thermosulfidooxidans]SMC06852.1 hypothetical protein SAMN00768000_3054 [Sulfobacillus thermosulfidooxidans DSM 9293]